MEVHGEVGADRVRRRKGRGRAGIFRTRQWGRFRYGLRRQAIRGFPKIAWSGRIRRYGNWSRDGGAHCATSRGANVGRRGGGKRRDHLLRTVASYIGGVDRWSVSPGSEGS